MKITQCPKCQMVINISNDDILNDVSVYCINNHYYPARKLVKGGYDPVKRKSGYLNG